MYLEMQDFDFHAQIIKFAQSILPKTFVKRCSCIPSFYTTNNLIATILGRVEQTDVQKPSLAVNYKKHVGRKNKVFIANLPIIKKSGNCSSNFTNIRKCSN